MDDIAQGQDAKLRLKAINCLQIIERLNRLLKENEINDYGDVTRFCEDADEVWNDLHDDLGKATKRASRLIRVIRHHQSEKE